jgi:hypothetical protein
VLPTRSRLTVWLEVGVCVHSEDGQEPFDVAYYTQKQIYNGFSTLSIIFLLLKIISTMFHASADVPKKFGSGGAVLIRGCLSGLTY